MPCTTPECEAEVKIYDMPLESWYCPEHYRTIVKGVKRDNTTLAQRKIAQRKLVKDMKEKFEFLRNQDPTLEDLLT